jgi:16S rRNA (uracil1498-N3)-methyltransferase
LSWHGRLFSFGAHAGKGEAEMTVPRLHVAERLGAGRELRLAGDRAHYLRNVLRLRAGAELRLFNAVDGEWRASVASAGRHEIGLAVAERVRAPAAEPGPSLAFAPIRRNRLEWLVEKAVELGVARLVPILTQRTVVRPEGAGRLEAIAVEAAEQCERLTVPTVDPPRPLHEWLAARPIVPLLFAHERGGVMPLGRALRADVTAELLVGPEGGFTPDESALLLARPEVTAVNLGPRILRAETAALYMLTAWQLARTPAA